MQLHFDNQFLAKLPGEERSDPGVRQVHGALWTRVKPTAVSAPVTLAWSKELAATLGLSESDCADPTFAEVFSGNRLLEGMDPFATCYGGHQFGNWAGQLGDGRAISLGEVVSPAGERWELQLKGAGPTPFSRHADGRAVLRSSLREFLCSEAMHHLGVPTTRALSLILTGDSVLRDMFYDGNAAYEPGAVVCRAAPSFLRFGHFELPFARGDIELLKTLTLFTLERDFPHLGPPSLKTVPLWLSEVAQRTGELIAHWMRVGFVHGVMNTDNLSILGLTIDYGPYGWLEGYDPSWTPNTTDAQGRRYAFGNQPDIGLWNLQRLVQAVYPLFEDIELAKDILQTYVASFQRHYQRMISDKLGLSALRPEDEESLLRPWFELLRRRETDMTRVYRALSRVPADPEADPEVLLTPFTESWYGEPEESDREVALDWMRRYTARLGQDERPQEERRAIMDRTNPIYVLRNWLAQEAIDLAVKGDSSRIHELLDTLRRPYEEQPGREHFAARRPEWARRRPGCSMLSCSS